MITRTSFVVPRGGLAPLRSARSRGGHGGGGPGGNPPTKPAAQHSQEHRPLGGARRESWGGPVGTAKEVLGTTRNY